MILPACHNVSFEVFQLMLTSDLLANLMSAPATEALSI